MTHCLMRLKATKLRLINLSLTLDISMDSWREVKDNLHPPLISILALVVKLCNDKENINTTMIFGLTESNAQYA